MTTKPWLAAKTAGEALLLAMPEHTYKAIAAALIEWHEAQREKVSEKWETYCMHKKHSEYYTRPELRSVKCRKSDGCYIVHVTRYRRKR